MKRLSRIFNIFILLGVSFLCMSPMAFSTPLTEYVEKLENQTRPNLSVECLKQIGRLTWKDCKSFFDPKLNECAGSDCIISAALLHRACGKSICAPIIPGDPILWELLIVNACSKPQCASDCEYFKNIKKRYCEEKEEPSITPKY